MIITWVICLCCVVGGQVMLLLTPVYPEMLRGFRNDPFYLPSSTECGNNYAFCFVLYSNCNTFLLKEVFVVLCSIPTAAGTILH